MLQSFIHELTTYLKDCGNDPREWNIYGFADFAYYTHGASSITDLSETTFNALLKAYHKP